MRARLSLPTLTAVLLLAAGSAIAAPYQATGFKICEVDQSSAIIWTRLTRAPARIHDDAPLPRVRYRQPLLGTLINLPSRIRPDWSPVVRWPKGATIETIAGSVPGMPGDVRIRYRRQGGAWKRTPWRSVDPGRDYTAQIRLDKLRPGSRYEIAVDTRASGSFGQTLTGHFRTAPRAKDAVPASFTAITGQAYPDLDLPGRGYKIYLHMLELDPDFFVHTGDIVYYDQLGKTEQLARWHWWRMYSLPTNVAFHRRIASYFIKDDHDTWRNDCWPGQNGRYMGRFTFEQGQRLFLEQVGMGESQFRTRRWGKDLQVWMLEGRDHRSPNPAPDGPTKTILGTAQKAWLKRTLRESDATFKVVITPTPIVGPDRSGKNDNHANTGFWTEGEELRGFLASQKNTYVVSGDRHWQYVSRHQATGLREYCTGPASDKHAGGYSKSLKQPEHEYLSVRGGFLWVGVERENSQPTLTFRHYSVDGEKLHEDTWVAK